MSLVLAEYLPVSYLVLLYRSILMVQMCLRLPPNWLFPRYIHSLCLDPLGRQLTMCIPVYAALRDAVASHNMHVRVHPGPGMTMHAARLVTHAGVQSATCPACMPGQELVAELYLPPRASIDRCETSGLGTWKGRGTGVEGEWKGIHFPSLSPSGSRNRCVGTVYIRRVPSGTPSVVQNLRCLHKHPVPDGSTTRDIYL